MSFSTHLLRRHSHAGYQKIEDQESDIFLDEKVAQPKSRKKYTINSSADVPQLDWTNGECLEWMKHLFEEQHAIFLKMSEGDPYNFTGNGLELWRASYGDLSDANGFGFGIAVYHALGDFIRAGKKSLNEFRAKGIRVPSASREGWRIVERPGRSTWNNLSILQKLSLLDWQDCVKEVMIWVR